MLTEHEQLADHEARISRQIPLNEPLENIGQITKDIENLHNGKKESVEQIIDQLTTAHNQNTRILLAAHALGGLMAGQNYLDFRPIEIAHDAVAAADAVLAELNEK